MNGESSLHRCAGPSCPGLPYRANDSPHPAACSATPERFELLGFWFRRAEAKHGEIVRYVPVDDLEYPDLRVCMLRTGEWRASFVDGLYRIGADPRQVLRDAALAAAQHWQTLANRTRTLAFLHDEP